MKKQASRETYETVFPGLRLAWLRKQLSQTANPYDEREWIATLCARAGEAFQTGTADGVRLAHRLHLEAATLALSQVFPDKAGGDHAPLADLKMALADLETGHCRKSLCPPPHTKRRGSKPSSSAHLLFKAVCIEAARLRHEAGESQAQADAFVLKQIADVARAIGLRIPKRFSGDGRRSSTIEGWRRAHSDRRMAAIKGAKKLHVSFEADPNVRTKEDKLHRAKALLMSLKKTSAARS